MTDELGAPVRRPGGLGAAAQPARRAAAAVLDVLIAVYALALLVVVTTGGFDLQIVRLTGAEKPILVLLLAVPVRAVLDEPSWLVALLRPLAARVRAAIAHATAADPALLDVLVAVGATRAATFFIGFMANLLYGRPAAPAFAMPFGTEKFAEIFAAWDSGWYFDIARRGYYYDPATQSSIAFFPLYPLLMRAVAWPFGGGAWALWTSGIVISCVAFVLALVALHRLTERITGDRETARRTVLYLAVFPFSLFFTRVYAESLFLLTSVLAVSRAWEGRWARAGVWGALATLTRPNGILIALPLALLALGGRPSWRALAGRAAWLALIPAALAGYSAFVYGMSGDPLGWLSSQAQWNYSLGHPPWQQLLGMIDRVVRYGAYDYFFVSPMAPFRLFHGVAALLFLGLTPLVFKRFGVALGCYVLASLLVPLSGDALEGIGRYAAVLFPGFMVLGGLRSPRMHESMLIAGSLFLALFVCLFVTLRPIY